VFSLDTSALIDAWRNQYRPSVFPSVWEKMTALIAGGELVASMSVRDEIRAQDDELAEWVENHPVLFLEDDDEVQARVRRLYAEWPRPTDFMRFLAGADPFVIGRAACHGFAVVTSERFSGSLDHPKIPDACRHYGVRCIAAMDMFEEMGWRF
jgi:predicted nucleic acid-binding protein